MARNSDGRDETRVTIRRILYGSARNYALAAIACGLGILVVACRDDTVAPLPKGIVPTNAARYSAAELHRRNPFDWIGQLHNRAMKAVVLELRKPNVSSKDLCSRMKAWLTNPENLGRANQEPRWDRERTAEALDRTPLCSPPGKLASAFRQVSWTSLTQSETPSATAEALYSQIEEAVHTATDPNNLAYQLSPIATAAEGLTSYDYTYVTEGIAIAQASFEHWYDENNFNELYDELADEYDLCFSGQYENGSFEGYDGITYICQGSEWRQSSFSGDRSFPQFRSVASVNCPEGDGIRWGWIGGGDVGGFKAGHWLSLRFDPAHSLGWAVIGAIGGSSYFAIREGRRLYVCGRPH